MTGGTTKRRQKGYRPDRRATTRGRWNVFPESSEVPLHSRIRGAPVIQTIKTAEPSASSGMLDDVASLTGVGGVLEPLWGKSPALLGGSRLCEWMPTSAELLETPLLRLPYLQMVFDGRPVAVERYTTVARVVADSPAERSIDRERIQELLNEGCSAKFNRLELWSPPLTAMARAIEKTTSKTVKVWGFLSPQGKAMVPVHRDPAHVIAVQIEGEKDWRLDGPPPAGRWFPAEPIAPAAEPDLFTLGTGDVLYMPHGHAHSAAAGSRWSFHISFALEGPTPGEFRTEVLKHLDQHLDRLDASEITPATAAAVLRKLAAGLAATSRRLEESAAGLADVDRRSLPDALAAVLAADLTK